MVSLVYMAYFSPIKNQASLPGSLISELYLLPVPYVRLTASEPLVYRGRRNVESNNSFQD